MTGNKPKSDYEKLHDVILTPIGMTSAQRILEEAADALGCTADDIVEADDNPTNRFK